MDAVLEPIVFSAQPFDVCLMLALFVGMAVVKGVAHPYGIERLREVTEIAFDATLATQGEQNLSVVFVCFDEDTVRIYEEIYGQ